MEKKELQITRLKSTNICNPIFDSSGVSGVSGFYPEELKSKIEGRNVSSSYSHE